MRLNELYHKFLENTATKEEVKEFWLLLAAASEEDPLWQEVYNTYNSTVAGSIPYDWTGVEKRLNEGTRRKASVISVRKWLSAACIALLAGVSVWIYVNSDSRREVDIAIKTVYAPERNKASITLANGSVLYLDSMATGQLSREGGNINLVKLADGQVAYLAQEGVSSGKEQFNTLANPKGSRIINMVLSDGTKVWLNAGSSLRFPVSFIGKERNVEITGEAYFEVAHNKNKPFRVHKDDVQIAVLGTRFNINAYDDGPDIKITLLDGSVRVSSGNAQDELLSQSKEQAVVSEGNAISKKYNVDIDEVLAWNNGYFSFNDADLHEVMRQLSRWYNVEVKYLSGIRSSKFDGKIPKDMDLQKVLVVLGESNVRYEFADNTITIKP